MAHLAFCRPSDVASGTYSGSGLTPLGSQYPFSALGNREPSEVFKANETTGRMVYDAGSKIDIQAWLLVHHRFAATRVLRLEGSDASDFSSIGLTQDVTVPAWHEDRFARNLWWDLVTRLPNAADRSWRYWSLRPTTSNDVAIAAGLWVPIRTLRRLPRDVRMGTPRREIDHEEIRNGTKGGVQSVYPFGTRSQALRNLYVPADDDTRLALEQLRRDALSGARPFFVALKGTEDASDLLNEPQWVEWMGGPFEVTWAEPNLHALTMQFRELSFGRPY